MLHSGCIMIWGIFTHKNLSEKTNVQKKFSSEVKYNSRHERLINEQKFQNKYLLHGGIFTTNFSPLPRMTPTPIPLLTDGRTDISNYRVRLLLKISFFAKKSFILSIREATL